MYPENSEPITATIRQFGQISGIGRSIHRRRTRGKRTCVEHADREELAREREREIQRMVDEEGFIPTDAAAVMNYFKPRW
jgi:hypothetical protein